MTALPRGGPRSQTQKGAIRVSVVSNLIVLAFFKFFNFGIESYNALVTALGWSHFGWDAFFHVILPLGISSYRFQALSYAIHVYGGEAEAMVNFIDFFLLRFHVPASRGGTDPEVLLFGGRMKHRQLTLKKFARGVAFFTMGLSKKILLAKLCGKIAHTTSDAGSVGPADAWFGAAACVLSTSTSARTRTWRSGSG